MKLETLVHTMEECGELVRACAKIIRHGEYTDPKYTANLIVEMGDVKAMMLILESSMSIDPEEVDKRVQEKLKKYGKYITIKPSSLLYSEEPERYRVK